MKKILILLMILLWQGVQAQKGRRLEILFLGDNGHHRPVERLPTLMAALGAKGVNFTYTDHLEDINPKNLAKYDALMIYANWDEITPAAEKALLDYVASGKGILPIHCASFCFRNSPEYVKLVGGQFWRHKLDTIQAKVVLPTHLIVKDLPQIKSYDETYLHSNLQPDNNVLMVREIKADQKADRPETNIEPYTWTRTYGKGRVFYTAYGHDDNTWSNRAFQQLLYNGIIWAVDEGARSAHAALNPKPFEYREAKLPNYEKRPGVQLQQFALSPEESMKHIQVPVDFTLDLFAAEPNVQHPIAMSWDEKGRLYVLITKDYPNERKDTGGSDFILICEDTDKDGKADKFTRFAEGLSIPTGMVFANGGLIVSQAPHMIFLKDTDGDDKADEKKILFSGFGTGDTHAGPSNLHYGFDNWIWGCVGYSGFKGKIGTADSLKFGQALFRFKPDGSKMEWVTSTSNNTWGMGFNEAGDVFGSTANNAHGWYMAIPHRNFLNPGFNTDNGSRSTDTHKDMKPITEKVRQVDVFGGFTAAAGHNFYTARAFPKNYWNQIAFVSEPTGHIVHQNLMEKKGTNYEDKDAFNLMAGADEWFSPVFAEVGPDGAVWVADWYSFIIQHNPVPKGFDNGLGNAYQTDLRDFTHGRIYRVGWKEAPAYTPLSLSKDRPDELISALKNTNMFWRSHAQRLLVERGKTDVVPALIALVKDQSVDEIGLNPAAIHALWALKGLGAIDNNNEALQAVIGALKHPSWAVQKNAIQVLPDTKNSVDVILQNDLLNSKEPIIVLNAVLALSELPLTPASEQALLNRMEQATESNDRWLPDAFGVALTSHKSVLLKKYLNKLTSSASAMPMNHDHSAMNHGGSAAASTPKEAPKALPAPVNGIDLLITNLRLDNSTPYVREGSRYYVEVKNNGKDSVKKGNVVSLKIDITGQGQKYTIWSMVHNSGIAPGETVTISKNTNGPWSGDFYFSADIAGDYTFNIMVDHENKIEENNEKNNYYSKKVSFQQAQKLSAFALERAARSYASVMPADTLAAMLKSWDKLPATENVALLKGISNGWNPRRKGTVTADNQKFLASLSAKLTETNADRLNKLLVAWGLKSSTADDDKDAIVINIRSIKEEMKFDKKEFTVKAGKPVVLIFENPDAMQHNIVIGKQKSMEIIGNAADRMITQKDAAEKGYVPAIPQVLAATPLVNPNETYRLKFTAPTEPGNYPYVCTFPGHWRLMFGTMKVVK